MKFLPISALLLFVLFSCKEKERPAGGPCSYDEKIYPATLIKLIPIDSLTFDASFETRMGQSSDNAPDTEFFHRWNNRYITAEEIKTDTILPGKIYKLVEATIITGSCNPHILSISMEKYSTN